MSIIKDSTRTDGTASTPAPAGTSPGDYGTDPLGKARKRILDITPDKPYDLAESKADSDKVLALLILELHDQGLATSQLADIASAMLHGRPRPETLTKVNARFSALDAVVNP